MHYLEAFTLVIGVALCGSCDGELRTLQHGDGTGGTVVEAHPVKGAVATVRGGHAGAKLLIGVGRDDGGVDRCQVSHLVNRCFEPSQPLSFIL